jgi:hypothetical protein
MSGQPAPRACIDRRDGQSRSRWFADSPLDGTGFEPSIPPFRSGRSRLACGSAVRAGFSVDSPLEGTGFEPSAPREASGVAVVPVPVRAKFTVGRESSRGEMSPSRNPGRVTRYRRFESRFLQRGVRCEPVSGGNSPSCVEKPRFSAGERAGASGAVGRDAQDAATSGLRAVISLSGHIPVPHRR